MLPFRNESFKTWATVASLGVSAVWLLQWYLKCPMTGSDNKKCLDGKIVVITGKLIRQTHILLG